MNVVSKTEDSGEDVSFRSVMGGNRAKGLYTASKADIVDGINLVI